MNSDNLITMSNQIGEFFESMPDREAAIADIAMHLKRFWAPPMRHRLLDSAAGAESAQLRQIVRDALTTHGAMLR